MKTTLTAAIIATLLYAPAPTQASRGKFRAKTQRMERNLLRAYSIHKKAKRAVLPAVQTPLARTKGKNGQQYEVVATFAGLFVRSTDQRAGQSVYAHLDVRNDKLTPSARATLRKYFPKGAPVLGKEQIQKTQNSLIERVSRPRRSVTRIQPIRPKMLEISTPPHQVVEGIMSLGGPIKLISEMLPSGRAPRDGRLSIRMSNRDIKRSLEGLARKLERLASPRAKGKPQDTK